jgi:hypothetical protein
MLPSCPIHTLASAYLVTESQHTHSLLTVLSTYSFYCIKSTHSYTSPTYITRYTFVYTHMSSHSTSKKAFFQINPKIVIFDSNMFSKHTLCLGKFHLTSITLGRIHKSTKAYTHDMTLIIWIHPECRHEKWMSERSINCRLEILSDQA